MTSWDKTAAKREDEIQHDFSHEAKATHLQRDPATPQQANKGHTCNLHCLYFTASQTMQHEEKLTVEQLGKDLDVWERMKIVWFPAKMSFQLIGARAIV